mgnify:FL=1
MISKEKLDFIKNRYPIGTRIKLDYMDDSYAVPSGTLGTIDYIDDEGQIGVSWDNGSSLSLLYGVDKFEVVDIKKDIEEKISI